MIKYFSLGKEITKEEAEKILQDHEKYKKSMFYIIYCFILLSL
jgi:hypothetical protein